MSEPKKYIYLQWYDEDGEPLDPHNEEVTWCQYNIYGHDVAYTRSDLVEAAIAQARAEERERILWAVYNRWGEGARDDVIEAIREAGAIRSMGDE